MQEWVSFKQRVANFYFERDQFPMTSGRPESELRDQIAGDLTLIEPGLTLVETEFHLKNPRGARGYIDILARDRMNKLVVIELKRSDSTARQAIHEIFKYVTLLRSEHGLGVDQVRCLLISTSWSELLVPFSEFVRTVEYMAEGKQMTLSTDGSVATIESVALVQDSPHVSLAPWHSIYLYVDHKDRKSELAKLVSGMRDAGIVDYVIALLYHTEDSSGVIYPYAIYAAMSLGFPKGEPLQAYTSPEYEKYDTLSFKASKRLHPNSLEIGYPDKFRQILRSWEIEDLVRGGRFSSDLLWPDDGLLGLILSEDGQHSDWLEVAASPRHAPSWKTFRTNLTRFLQGNDVWHDGVSYVLDEIREEEATASIEIFNPRDIITSISYAARHQNTYAFPLLELVISDEGGARVIKGYACWDGETRPTNPEALISSVLPGGIAEYLDRYHFDLLGECDPEMMGEHGLSYELFEVSGGRFMNRFDVDSSAWMEFDETQRGQCDPVVQFLISNREYVRRLEALVRPAFEHS